MARDRARRALARGHDERVQPARQHGRPRGEPRCDRSRLLRDRRRLASRTSRGSCSSLPSRSLRRARLPAVQPSARQGRARLDGRQRLAGDRLHARRARACVELHRRVVDRRHAPRCRCSCSPCRSSTRRSSPSSGFWKGARSRRADATTAPIASSRSGSPRPERSCSSRSCRPLWEPRASPTRRSAAAGIAALGVLMSFALAGAVRKLAGRCRTGNESHAAPGSTCAGSPRSPSTARSSAASFLAAYLLRFNGIGTPNQRHYFLLTLPVLLFCRYIALLGFGMYAGVWRYASARDALRAACAVALSAIAALGIRHPDAGIDRRLLAERVRHRHADLHRCDRHGARFAERAIPSFVEPARRREARRVLIVGAGRTGRSLLASCGDARRARGRASSTTTRSLVGRRLNGTRSSRSLDGIASVLERFATRVVLVTIPNAAHDVLDALVASAPRADAMPLRAARRRSRPEDRPREVHHAQ